MTKISRLLTRAGASTCAVLANFALCAVLLHAAPLQISRNSSETPTGTGSLSNSTTLTPPSSEGLDATIIPGGYVSGTWPQAGSPYLIDSTIVVHNDSTLTIEAGVEVRFQGHYQFKVEGKLYAVGTESDSILFTSDDLLAGWGGLRLVSATVSSKLEYCHFTLGNAQGTWPENCGGALYIYGTISSIKHCSFVNNRADYDGGAIFLWGATPTFSYNLFTDNNCTSATGKGHAIYMGNCQGLTLNHLTISGNGSGTGSSLYVAMGTTLKMTNSILWDSFSFGFNLGEIEYSDIYDTVSDTLNAMGIENISSDPKFVNPAAGDFHLKLNSPCIDAASPNSPYGNETEPNGGRANMGAYGNSTYASQSLPLLSFIADSINLSIVPDSTNFGLQKINTPDTLSYDVQLHNLGRDVLEVQSINISADQFGSNFQSLVDTSTNTIRVQPDSTVTLILTFTPDAIAIFTATLSFTDNDISSDPILDLSGTGVNPVIAVSPDSLWFGNLTVGVEDTQQVTIYNIGQNMGGIESILELTRFYGTDNFRIVDAAGSVYPDASISVGDSLSYFAIFSPQSQLPFDDSVRIASNAGDAFVRMLGSGSQPVMNWNDESDTLEFGVVAVDDSATWSFDLWNTGSVALVLEEFTFNPTDENYSVTASKTELAQGETATISVTFHPAEKGVYDYTLDIDTNQPTEPATGGGWNYLTLRIYLFATATSQTNYWYSDTSGTWITSMSPYYVVGDITISSGNAIVIEPGVEVKFEGDFQIQVLGTLDAQGTATSPIQFSTVNGGGETWSGITFKAGSSNSILSYCKFTDGSAEDGGVVRVENSSPTIASCEFYGNSATRGGAIALKAWSQAAISNCNFHHNSATASGGAIFGDWYANIQLMDCQIDSNSAANGGGVYLSGTSGWMESCEVFDNTATAKGGGMFIGTGSDTELFENDVYGNSAPNGGGLALLWYSKPFVHDNRIYSNSSATSGGGIFIQDGCTPVIVRTLIAENSAPTGNAIYTLSSGSIINYCTLTATSGTSVGWLLSAGAGDQTLISNSILGEFGWSDVSYSAVKRLESELVITYSDVLDSTSLVFPGLGNDNTDPFFAGGDDIVARYQLLENSPAQSMSEDDGEIGFNGGSSSLAWNLTLALLQNPVQPASMHFVLTTTVPLKSSPYVYLEQDFPDTVAYTPVDSAYMEQIAPLIYSLPIYQDDVEHPTKATISFVNIFGSDTTLVQDFVASNLSSDDATIGYGQIITATGRAASGSGLWWIYPEYYCGLKPLDAELLAIGQAYQISATDLDIADGRVEFQLDTELLDGHSAEACGIAYWNENTWDLLPSYLTGDKNAVWATLDKTGTYRLVWGSTVRTVQLPTEVSLAQNYPNPFNPETIIQFALPDQDRIRLQIFDVMGRMVITLWNGQADPGYHRVNWNGLNSQGVPVASGVYFYRLQSGSQVLSKKMILLR